jgi:hypothetical protein
VMFSAQSLSMAAHATMEYVMPLLSNICTATGERYFLCGPCRDYIMISYRLYLISGHVPRTRLDAKTDRLTDRQSQCDSDSDSVTR